MATIYSCVCNGGTSSAVWAACDQSRYGGTRCYTGIKGWRDARYAAGVGAFDIEICEILEAFTETVTAAINLDLPCVSQQITTSVNGVRTAAYHNNVWGGGYKLETSASYAASIGIKKYNCVVDGIELYQTNGFCYGIYADADTGSKMTVTYCMIKGGASGVRYKGYAHIIHDNVVVNCSDAGILAQSYRGQVSQVYNNLSAKNKYGFSAETSSGGNFYNNIAIGNTTANWTAASSSLESASHNMGVSGDVPWGTNAVTTLVTTDFVDYANNDFRPASSSRPQVNAGTAVYDGSQLDILGKYRPDYESATYPSNLWDIGPFEYDHGEGNAPPNYRNFIITGLVSGSRVKIKKTSDGTSIYNAVVNATSLTISYNAGTANTPVTIDIRKGSAAPYYKPYRTTSSISYLADTEISVAQIEAIAADTYPAQIATDWSINTGTKAITRNSGGQYSLQDLYSWLLDYYDDSSTVDLDMPIEGITPNQFELINSGSISDADMQYLNNGSLWSGTTLWANLTVVGTLAANTTVYVHVDGSEYTPYWSTGNINVSLKFPAFDGTETVDVRAHKYTDTYDHWHFDSIGEGLNYAALSTADDPNNQTAEGTVAAYGITVTVDNPTDQQIDAYDTPADYTTTVNANGRGVQEVYEYLKYLTKEKSTYVSANASYAEVKDAPYGTFAGGQFFGARGIWLTNVASGDALNYVLTDNDGNTHQAAAPPVQISVTNLVVGERFQLYDQTNNIELVNTVATGTSYSLEKSYTQDLDIRLRHIYVSGATATVFQEEFGTFTSIGLPMRATQEPDPIYNVNAINGSVVTGITIDDTHLLVSVTTGSMSLQEIYAYETYWLSTEAGIRDEGRFIDATDVANYVWHEFKLKNTSSPSVPLVITGGYVRDADTNTAIAVLDTSGGTVFFAPDHVVPYAAGAEATVAIVQAGLTAQGYTTGRAPKMDNLDIPVSEAGGGTGGLTTDEHNKLMSLSTTNLDVAVSTRAVAADLNVTVNAPDVTVNPTLTTDQATQLEEIHGRLGLDAAAPMTTTQTAITFGDVTMALTGNETSTTVTRQ